MTELYVIPNPNKLDFSELDLFKKLVESLDIRNKSWYAYTYQGIRDYLFDNMFLYTKEFSVEHLDNPRNVCIIDGNYDDAYELLDDISSNIATAKCTVIIIVSNLKYFLDDYKELGIAIRNIYTRKVQSEDSSFLTEALSTTPYRLNNSTLRVECLNSYMACILDGNKPVMPMINTSGYIVCYLHPNLTGLSEITKILYESGIRYNRQATPYVDDLSFSFSLSEKIPYGTKEILGRIISKLADIKEDPQSYIKSDNKVIKDVEIEPYEDEESFTKKLYKHLSSKELNEEFSLDYEESDNKLKVFYRDILLFSLEDYAVVGLIGTIRGKYYLLEELMPKFDEYTIHNLNYSPFAKDRGTIVFRCEDVTKFNSVLESTKELLDYYFSRL